jgi:acetolactate synthase I/II/III large subunit
MATGANYRKQQSDVIVDLLHRYGFKYATLNPGASFRGLHDSIVNYGGDKPQMLLCQHEKTAVQIAHGYARATGEPMVAIVHDVVGLLHAELAIYYAFVDRAPVFVIGATGPMDEAKRRPRSDWHHTAQVQGEAVRNFTKYDYQPHTIEGVPDAFMRAYAAMLTEPCGPVYMCYDALLQETPLSAEVAMPPDDFVPAPTPMAADRQALDPIVDTLLAAERPFIMTEFSGRHPGNFEKLVALAETVGAAVWDNNGALCFPNRHPLALSMDTPSLAKADAILALDVRDWERQTARLDSTTRELTSILDPSCEWMNVGFHELGLGSWALDHGRYLPTRHSVLGDPRLAMPEMADIARRRLAADTKLAARVEARKREIAALHDAAFARWAEQAREERDASPVTLARLAEEVWSVIRDEDWVCATGTLRDWARKLWDFDRPYRHPGSALGTATQIGMSLGVALAHKGSGRLVVALQPDGDLMFDVGALWTAAKHRIPLLVVMFNNRAYYNDWHHQIRMANLRGTDVDKAHIGMDIFDPEPDFGAAARSMGMWGEGPIDRPDDIAPALRRAIEVVKTGKPALVDVVTQHR